MAKLTRSSVLFPFCCVFISFILSSLLIFSGWRKGFLDELALVRVCDAPAPTETPHATNANETLQLNVKAIADGKPLVTGPNGTVQMDELPPWVKFNVSQKDTQQESAEQNPRIAEWFSLHLLTSCHGQYLNGTSDSDGYLRVLCSEPNPIRKLYYNDF